jgi:hypothetical protein
MTLREKQSLFARLLANLVVAAFDMGYEVTFGDVFATTGHMADSLHGKRLAADLNLFKDGKYLETTEAHKPLGEVWKRMHPLCRWGGDFKNPDGNHYSITHGGKA